MWSLILVLNSEQDWLSFSIEALGQRFLQVLAMKNMIFVKKFIDLNKQRLGHGSVTEIITWINSTTEINNLWRLNQLRHA